MGTGLRLSRPTLCGDCWLLAAARSLLRAPRWVLVPEMPRPTAHWGRSVQEHRTRRWDGLPCLSGCDDGCAALDESRGASRPVPSETAAPRTSQIPVRIRCTGSLRFHWYFCREPPSLNLHGFRSLPTANETISNARNGRKSPTRPEQRTFRVYPHPLLVGVPLQFRHPDPLPFPLHWPLECQTFLPNPLRFSPQC